MRLAAIALALVISAYGWRTTGQFRFGGGKLIGPFYVFADVVHSYEGASIDEVMRDVRAAVR